MNEQNNNGLREEVEEAVSEITDEAVEKAEQARDVAEDVVRGRNEQVQDAVTRLRGLVTRGNQQLLVVERQGRVWLKLPLSVAVVGGVIVALASMPVVIVGAILGLVLGVSLQLEDVDSPGT